jgi:hypothetical protein
MSRYVVAVVSCVSLVAVVSGPAHGQEKETPDLAVRLGRLPGVLIQAKKTDGEIIDALFLAALVRPATETEKTTVLTHLKKAGKREQASRDLLWALVNSTEFTVLRGLDWASPAGQAFQEKITKELEKK